VPSAATVDATPLHSPHQYQPPPPTPVPRAPKQQLLTAAMSHVDGVELVHPGCVPGHRPSPAPHYLITLCIDTSGIETQECNPGILSNPPTHGVAATAAQVMVW
jgi:hypothetical protein